MAGVLPVLLALPHSESHRIHRQSIYPIAEATRNFYCSTAEFISPWQNCSPVGETNGPYRSPG